MRKTFDESEMQVIGEYKPMMGFFGKMQPAYPKYNRPVTPKENYEMMANGEIPYWTMNLLADFNLIQPLIMGDASARSFGGIDWFGIDWQMEDLTGAPMVRPGTRRLSVLENWEEELVFPDLDTIDWQKDFDENYKESMYEDRPSIFLVVNGYFERIGDLTSFEDAFCYLLEEPEELDHFFSALDDFHMKLARVAREVYHADIFMMHDDMGSQKRPFFSESVYREVMMPHYRKISDCVHSLGMKMASHSCGCIGERVPLFKECGFDMWEGQRNCNDMCKIMHDTKDLILIGYEPMPAGLSDEEAYEHGRSLARDFGFDGRYMLRLYDSPERYVKTNEELYRYSRQMLDKAAARA